MAKNNNTILWIGVAVAAAVLFMSFTSNSGNGISSSQIEQTKSFEVFRSTAYPDGSDSSGNQLYSIGYGHQIQPNEQYLLTQTITQEQADTILMADLQPVLNTIVNSGVNWSQGQIDSLSDFGLNAGTGALSNVISSYQSGGNDAATAKMMQYVYWHPVPGGSPVLNQNLVNRRNIEVATFNS